MSTRALYPGSFDPPTRGHFDLIERAAGLFDELIVAVGVNPAKEPLLSVDERVGLIRGHVGELEGVSVDSFTGLAVDAAGDRGCSTVIRGLRTVSDFEAEHQMALMNRVLAPGLETLFMVPGEKFSFVSSRLIKEILAMEGDASAFLTDEVARVVRKRIADRT